MSRKQSIILFIAFSISVWLLWSLRSHENLLMEKTRFVARSKDLGIALGNPAYWASDHELLIQQNTIVNNKRLWTVFKYDIVSRRNTQMTALVRLFEQTDGFGGDVSPDGKWIEWFAGDSKQHTSMLDASRHLSWPTPGISSWQTGWSSEGGIMLAFADSPKEEVFQLIRPTSTDGGKPVKVPFNGFQSVLVNTSCFCELPNGLIRTCIPMYPSGVTVTDVDPSKRMSIASQHSIRFAGEDFCREVKMSADGKRIAALCTKDLGNGWPSFLLRFLPFLSPTTRKRTTLWSAGIDGKRLIEIGHVLVTNSPDSSSPSDLKWLPGEKKVSFGKDDKMYVVSIADEEKSGYR